MAIAGVAAVIILQPEFGAVLAEEVVPALVVQVGEGGRRSSTRCRWRSKGLSWAGRGRGWL